jgi:hypothetical protein
MAELLHCTDRWGRDIILTDAQWDGHILPGHGELTGNLSCIREALENPTLVNHDVLNPNGENFYCLAALPAPFDQVYLKVCVRFTLLAPNGPWRGEVVTAYATTTVKPREAQKWP